MRPNYLKLILICAMAVGVFVSGHSQPTKPDSAQILRRVAATVRLAAEEYALGVKDGKIVLAPEVGEAKLFLAEAKKAAALLPAGRASSATAAINLGIARVEQTGSPDSIRAEVEALVQGLAREMGVTLDEIPATAPSLARGESIYRAQCAGCHGLAGLADGLAAVGLTPPPSRLADSTFFRGASPLDFYRRITIGVAGTSMVAFESSLSAPDRWAAALYASTLRLPAARGTVPRHLADFSKTAALGDAALLDSLGTTSLARVAAIRAAADGARVRDFGPVFATVHARLDSAFDWARRGQSEASRSAAISAYMAFEAVERELRIKDADLVTRAERAFAEVREPAGPEQLAASREELTRVLDRAERTLGTSLTPISLFIQSFLILIREGLEAILVIGALIAFLAKVGANERRRDIHLGVGVALALSVVTAIAIETIFRLKPAHQEALEGFTMVVATVMLFSVSYWLLSKMEVAKWNQFVKSKLSEALTKRSMFALASVAFLAVYREGFETVLFYKALAVSGGTSETAAPIVLGFLAAAAALGVIYVAINRFGVRLPLRPFFGVTSGLLYVMAFIFAGTAVAELQEGGFISLTTIDGMFRAPTFGIYPTVESVLAQTVLVLLATVALAWTFVVAPRRERAVARATASPDRHPEPGRRRARGGSRQRAR